MKTHRGSEWPLSECGLNFPVTIFPAGSFPKEPPFPPVASISVQAHFDTGAQKTAIDIGLAKHLNLAPLGSATIMTAGGLFNFPVFAVNLQFPGTTLSPFVDLPVNSCRLGFNINGDLNSPKNRGILLGRDVMSR